MTAQTWFCSCRTMIGSALSSACDTSEHSALPCLRPMLAAGHPCTSLSQLFNAMLRQKLRGLRRSRSWCYSAQRLCMWGIVCEGSPSPPVVSLCFAPFRSHPVLEPPWTHPILMI
eukprot:scaffold71600_cov22-Tisochrysis_lutea.AAC.1